MIALDADGIDLDALTPAQKMGAAFAVVRSESSLAAVRSPLPRSACFQLPVSCDALAPMSGLTADKDCPTQTGSGSPDADELLDT